MIPEAVKIWRKSSYDEGVAIGYNDLGQNSRDNKKYAEAKLYYKKALELANTLNMKVAKIYIPINMGVLSLDNEEWILAQRQFEKALALAKKTRNIDLIAQAQYGLSRALNSLGHIERARPALKEAIALYKRLQHNDLPQAEKFLAKINQAE
jgi:tetratricopeptide (TPR) repeat protein